MTPADLARAIADRYTIERELGQGGMATVYLARDIRHERRVALKVLKPELGAVLGVERFLAEIRVTANLQHPNLLPLFDSGEANGLLFYVMPYVDGETLRQRIDRERQLPIEEALRITRAVAGALDYAHRRGVIHRDLKPENILLHEGEPLVADFGIALAVSNAGGMRITQTGISLGTPQYMSPEQATGDRAVDGRTDVYSLGAVLYEMLTGEPPHMGTTAQAIVARVLTEKPRPILASRPSTPEHVDVAVGRALEKLPADRWATAHEFAEALTLRGQSSARVAALSQRAHRRRFVTVIPRVVALLATAGAVAALAAYLRRPDQPTTRFVISTAPGQSFLAVTGVPIAMAPDGRGLLYSGRGPRGTQLYYRRFEELESRAIPGTENATTPFLSANGRMIGFSRGYEIVTMPITGGPATVIGTSARGFRSPFWASNGDVFAGTVTNLVRIPQGKRTLDTLTRGSGAGESLPSGDYGTPILLADGKTLLFWIRAPRTQDERLALLHLDTRTLDTLEGEASNPLGVLDGYLLFGRSNGTVNAVRFEPGRTRSLADAVPVVEDVVWRSTGGVVASISPTGSLAYVRGTGLRRLMIVDEHGVAIGGDADLRDYTGIAFSPDGTRLAVGISSGVNSDIWSYDLASAALTRLTQQSRANNPGRPSWSPDGKRVGFAQRMPTAVEAWWVASDGSAPEERIATVPVPVGRVSLTPDGRNALIVTPPAGARGSDIWVLSLDGTGPARPLIKTEFHESDAAMSPDGSMIAYASTESSTPQVYV